MSDRVLEDAATIWRPGGLDPVVVPVANVACSWEVNAAGSFSAFARVADLRAVGLGGSLAGLWVEWRHPRLGRWGGVVTGRPAADGVVEIAAEGYLALLRGRVLEVQDAPPPGPAGGVLRRAVVAAGRSGVTHVAIGTVDEGGEYVTAGTGGEDIADAVLPRVAEEGGVEFAIDADRRFHVQRRLGRDLSGTRRLVEDRHVPGFRLDDDLWASQPGARLVSTGSAAVPLATAAQVPAAATPHAPPVTRVAPRPRPVLTANPYAMLLGAAGLGALVPAWAAPNPYPPSAPTFPGEAAPPPGFAQTAPAPVTVPAGVGANSISVPTSRLAPVPTVPMELTLADADGCWGWFGLGDTLRVELGSVGFAGRFRVMVVALDAAAGALTVGGEAQADA